ncbi:HAD-IC family P-type ATPase [Anthropogastromicrobium aceti]|uniref:HAD-IC family P-type ATPase n=1 Tax=Anthropogastromicrobium aceti TaxID=2981768 RepID=UPI000821255C|nr:HAD-IC family P-type ATPase [Anthropogastromicrobium aceti]MCU6783157.1 HAD-IC family P-type ATPase [Anthropogastromicrobium aceti]SCJ17317.1 Calcium-transporting ATPase lmo0841 [uncultured Lachnospira sp.]
MGDNEELSVDQETVDQKVDQPEIGDEPQPQNSTDDFDPKKHTRVQTGANGELCFQGLTQAEVEARIADGQVNAIQDSSNRSVKDIVMGNTLTFFNFINIVLLALVLSVRSYKNMLFIFIIIANTLIGIFQEIKAKITLDKLKILTVSHVDVIRDGVKKSVTVSELVKDDVILLKSGGQIPADGVILDGEVDVNESLLTGESDSIHKTCGSKVLSGSFVTSGKAMCLLTEVGHDCYMEKLSSEAKQFKRYKTELQRNLDTILKFISIIIVPLGIILFAKQYWISGSTYEQAALDTVAAVLGMIPEGLVLLTSVALALGAVRLARRSTLVRELFCIETLARVDTLCLDKTGTITEGHLCVQGEESVKEDIDLEQLMGRMVSALGDENETFQALRQHYKRNQSTNTKLVLPFSSERKFSGVVFEGEGTYLMGAYQFIFPQADPAVLEKIAEYASQGLRVLTIAHSPNEMTDYTLAEDFEIVGFVFMTDVVRKNAPDILGYFEEQGVDLKVISGDDPVTVAAIAARAGLKDADKYIDATTIHTDEEMEDAILKYSVFGRVTPKQKQQMVRLLKQNGRTVAMTGDGVNDVLALKDADVSIAMASGSEAAKNTANLVLLNSDFASLPHIVNEGRRVINNIKAAASMFLIKTGFSVLTALLTIIVGQNYPFQPIQLSVINGCAVAIPTMLLQLEPSFQKVNKHFFREVLRMSMPAAITITAMITIINNIGHSIGTPREMLSTVCVLATGWVYLITLRQVYSPMTGYRKFVIYLMQTAYLVAMVIGQRIMELVGLNFTCVIVTLAAVNFAPMIIDLATKGYDKFFYWYDHRHDVKPPKPIKVKTRRFRGV